MYTYTVELHSNRGHWIEIAVTAASAAEAMARAEEHLRNTGLDWSAHWAVSQGATH